MRACFVPVLLAACGGEPVGSYGSLPGPPPVGQVVGAVTPSDAADTAAPAAGATRDRRAPDADGDGHASLAWGGDDCDDGDATVHPGAEPACSFGADANCDGLPDCALAACACAADCREVCDNGVDDDGDGLADCDDDDCHTWVTCAGHYEDCGNGLDDDGNGLTDCDDPDCDAQVPCGEDCDNGIDDDHDGLTDCDDPGCALRAPCGEDCDDGVDDDGDGLTDCEDDDCGGVPACAEDCSNGLDDDCDGLVDCEDRAACSDDARCQEVCDNGVDDDYDGLTDCEDRGDCRRAATCREVCDNGVDDDYDGLTDCEDTGSCAGDPACVEVCDNGVDDDYDGLTDCDDEDCAAAAGCYEDCSNGVDDDDDGLVDCEDGECAGELICSPDPVVTVRVAAGRGRWYDLRWWSASISSGCSAVFWFSSGTLESWDSGRSCVFTGGRLWFRPSTSWACAGPGIAAVGGGWRSSPRLSSACSISLTAWSAPPQWLDGLKLTAKGVGDTAGFTMWRTTSPTWLATGRVRVTWASSSLYGSTWYERSFTLASPLSWDMRLP